MKELLYPRLSLKAFAMILLLSVYGALIAGTYGIIHDQVTYTLSPEYFTKFKFDQFYDVDPGLGDRAFAGVIGFMATAWIGLIVGWVMARLSMGTEQTFPSQKLAMQGMLITFGVCVLFGVIGFLYGTFAIKEAPESWTIWQKNYHITYMKAFTRVAYVHNMGYIGGAVGSIIAGIYVVKKSRDRYQKIH